MSGDCAFYEVGCQINELASDAADATLGSFLRWMASSVKATTSMGRYALGQVTDPEFGGWWQTGPYRTMWWIAGSLLVLMTVAAVVSKMVRSDTAGMGRVVFVGVPLVLLGMSLVPWLASSLAGWVDSASAGIESQSNGSIDAVWGALESSLGDEGVSGGLVLVLLQVAMMLAVLILYVAMLLRTVAIYLVVAAVPLALVVGMFGPAKKVLVRTVEVSLALIVSKLFVAMALYVGAAGLGATLDAGAVPPPSKPDQATSVSADPARAVSEAERMNAGAAGVLILMVAGFAPLALLAMIPGAEAAVESARTVRAGAREARQAAGQISGGDRLLSSGRMAAGMAMSQGMGMALGSRGQPPGGSGGSVTPDKLAGVNAPTPTTPSTTPPPAGGENSGPTTSPSASGPNGSAPDSSGPGASGSGPSGSGSPVPTGSQSDADGGLASAPRSSPAPSGKPQTAPLSSSSGSSGGVSPSGPAGSSGSSGDGLLDGRPGDVGGGSGDGGFGDDGWWDSLERERP